MSDPETWRRTIFRFEMTAVSEVETCPDDDGKGDPDAFWRQALAVLAERIKLDRGSLPEGRLLRFEGVELAIEYPYPPGVAGP